MSHGLFSFKITFVLLDSVRKGGDLEPILEGRIAWSAVAAVAAAAAVAVDLDAWS